MIYEPIYPIRIYLIGRKKLIAISRRGQSVEESAVPDGGFGHGGLRLYPLACVVVEVGLLVEKVDAEEIVDEVELLLVAHPVELAGHLVVLGEVDPQQAGLVERLRVRLVQVGTRVLLQPLGVALLVLEQLLLPQRLPRQRELPQGFVLVAEQAD